MSDRAIRGPVGSSGDSGSAIRGPGTGRSDGYYAEEIIHPNVLYQTRHSTEVESGEGAGPAPGPTPPDGKRVVGVEEETEAENLA